LPLSQSNDEGSKPEFPQLIPQITDFGLAKLNSAVGRTRTGAIMGTPSYMAPEHASVHPKGIGPTCDIYSLGAILYELLAGRPPFRAETPLETIREVVDNDPVPPRRLAPKAPRDLETICLKCLEKAPVKRYAIAGERAESCGLWVVRASACLLWHSPPTETRWPVEGLTPGSAYGRRRPTKQCQPRRPLASDNLHRCPIASKHLYNLTL
jgi:serine/threonine protein kinase